MIFSSIEVDIFSIARAFWKVVRASSCAGWKYDYSTSRKELFLSVKTIWRKIREVVLAVRTGRADQEEILTCI